MARKKIEVEFTPGYSETIPGLADKYDRERRQHIRFVFGGSLLRIVFAVILFVTVLRFLLGYSPVTFTSFLEMLRDVPVIPTSWLSGWSTNLAVSFPDWLSWLGAFFDWFVSAFQMCLFVSIAIVNIFPFIFYFVRWLLFV